MKDDLEKLIGLTIESVEVGKAYDDLDCNFVLTFTQGTKLIVSSRGWMDGSSVVTVDIEH